MTYRISEPSTFTRSIWVRMFHGQSLIAAFCVVTDADACARTTRRTPRRYWPALTCPPPGVCDVVTVLELTIPTLFFSQYKFVASWNGFPPPPPPPTAAGAPAAAAAGITGVLRA